MKNATPLLKKAVLTTAFFIGLLLLVSSCSRTPDEEQIQLIIDEVIAAVESGKAASIGDHLHTDFRANGQMDVQQVKQMLMMYGLQNRHLSVTRLSTETRVDPVYTDKAETVMSIIVSESSKRGLPDDGSARVIRMEWRRDGDWKLLGANWEE